MKNIFKKDRTLSIVLSVVLSFFFVFVGVNAATTISTNISTGGTLTVTGASTLTGATTITGLLTTTGGITSGANFVSDTDSTDSLGVTGTRWASTFSDNFTGNTITLDGATGVNILTIPTNLADALSIIDSAGDLMVFKTSTGAQLLTITPATTITGALTASAGITSSKNITVPAAYGLDVATGGALNIGTTTATSITIGKSGITTTFPGDLTVSGTFSPAITAVSSAFTVTSAGASSLAVGRLGATTPAFSVDSSTGSQTAGFKVTGAALNGTVALVVTDTSGNTNLTINALGSGTIGIGSVSTGAVTITPATTITGLLTTTGGITSGSNLVSDTDSTDSLGVTGTRWASTFSDNFTGNTITLDGVTGVNILTIPTNLADALSIIDSAGDLMVFKTSTGAQSLTITPATTITGLATLLGGATTTSITLLNGETIDNITDGMISLGGKVTIAGAALGSKLTSSQTTAPVVTAAGGTGITCTNGAGTAAKCTDMRGQARVTTANDTAAVVVTFNVAYTVAPVCVVSAGDATTATNATTTAITTSTTALTLTPVYAWGANAKIFNYICVE